MSTPSPVADRNLIFGLLALQMDFVTREQLLDAMHAWMLQKGTPLGQILCVGGVLDPDDRADLDRLVQKHIRRHGGDAHASLAALRVESSVRQDLLQLGDADLEFSIDSLPTPRPDVTPLTTHPALPTGGAPRYRKLHLHAKGGLGEVHLAMDEELHREVALKEIQDHYADFADSRSRFLREAEITGNLEHPGVVPVYGLGADAHGRPYYAMRFIRGQSMQEAIAQHHKADERPRRDAGERRLETRELLSRFVAVCHAVGYAHMRGVIHRDLKPSNVMLGEYGETIVIDWGLARHISQAEAEQTTAERPVPSSGSASAPTAMGQVVGTPAYMPAEQAQGRVDLVGPASDVFALGATLYCLLTGTAPYSGKDIVEQAQRGQPVPARQRKRTVPAALEAVCTKAMATAPSERYSSAKALAEEVQRWLADEPLVSYRDPPLSRLGRWTRRHQPLVAGIAVAFVSLLSAAALLWYRHVQVRDEVRNQVAQRVASGLSDARAGDLDRAQQALSEAAGLCQLSNSLPDLQDEVAGHLQELDRFRAFKAQAAAVLREGVHNVRGSRGIALLDQSEKALAMYEVTASPDWQAGLPQTSLIRELLPEINHLVEELLQLTAIRLALFDTRDETGKANTLRALSLLDRAAALQEPSTGVWMLRMLWHRRLGDNKEADQAGEAMSESAKKGAMKTARDYYLFGSVTLQILKDPKRALTSYQQALKREPNHYGAHFGAFLCNRDLKDFGAQLAHLSVCLALRPDEAELYYFRGMAYFELRQYSHAYQDFDAAVLRNPKYERGYFYRGRMQVMFEKWAEAEKDFTKALELDPKFTQCLSWRAVARAKTDRHREAALDADEIVGREPDDWLTLTFAARAYAQSVRAALVAKDEALAKKYGDRAIELLGRALTNGFNDPGRLGQGSDFDPLRGRADFLPLVKRAEEAAKAIPKKKR